MSVWFRTNYTIHVNVLVELLEILSETADPLRIQPFLKKCFEGINQLEFNDVLDITAMTSSEGETIPFNNDFDECNVNERYNNGVTRTYTINPTNSRGQVEIWLHDVEVMMRKSVFFSISRGMMSYTLSTREAWICQSSGQVALAVSNLYWTHDSEAAIKSECKGALNELELKATDQLAKLVQCVRGDLTPLQRKTCSALIVIDVHNRDVLTKIKDTVSDIEDFDWILQLRYYFDKNLVNNWAKDDSCAGSKTLPSYQGSIKASMINTDMQYAYEYLGNTGRLVITPLTDRCYRTLTAALNLNLGGAAEGPAGTGKTETTKDLAKAFAIQCVVFNCSDQLEYLQMAKFFKGLIGAGAWACFDEFNRIQLDVLSVVAQQISMIQFAKASLVEYITFEGTTLELNERCNICVTMNPGEKGRTELPDNLKVLFRSVAMMVPDYALIAEIILYSYGYLDARVLGSKIVTLYRLCSEQLSKVDHYDYSMRGVTSVLRAAGNLKAECSLVSNTDNSDVSGGAASTHMTEKELVLRAIKDINEPMFLQLDGELFSGIVSDLFPGVDPPPVDYSELRKSLNSSCAKLSLQATPYFTTKCIQLYEMVKIRHGVMIVGSPMAGKSGVWKVLSDALSELTYANKMNENRTYVSSIMIAIVSYVCIYML